MTPSRNANFSSLFKWILKPHFQMRGLFIIGQSLVRCLSNKLFLSYYLTIYLWPGTVKLASTVVARDGVSPCMCYIKLLKRESSWSHSPVWYSEQVLRLQSAWKPWKYFLINRLLGLNPRNSESVCLGKGPTCACLRSCQMTFMVLLGSHTLESPSCNALITLLKDTHLYQLYFLI